MFHLQKCVQSPTSVDCIRQCPWQPNLYAFAFYQTNPQTVGGIAVKNISNAHDIDHIQILSTPPLLHIVWSQSLQDQNSYIIAASSRTNDIHFFNYRTCDDHLELITSLTVGQNIFCLYLDMTARGQIYELVVSTDNSKVIQLQLTQNLQPITKKQFDKHEYAVWCCRISPSRSQSFACGDQVNSLYVYDQGKLVAKNNKAHQGGICDVCFGPDQLLYSGGFDGIVNVLDLRMFDKLVYQHNWGGTIWRVLPNADYSYFLLCNSSEKKFQIVTNNLQQELWNSADSHGSLAYAADWGNSQIITASFYDKKTCLWLTPNLE